MLFRHDQSGFCTTYSFKSLVLEWKYKNNLKNRESQYIYIYIYILQLLQFSYTYLCNVLIRNSVVLPRF